MEAERQRDFELVIIVTIGCTTSVAGANDAVQVVPIDLAVDVTVVVTTREAAVFIRLHFSDNTWSFRGSTPSSGS